MKKAFAVLVVLAMFPVGGCASSSPAPHPSPRAFDNVRRLTIVASGETRFAVLEHSSEPGRTHDLATDPEVVAALGRVPSTGPPR